MRTHLTDDMLAEALDGLGSAEARRHLAECVECTAKLDEARLGLELAQASEVPEPPPLYWEVFRRQVGHRINEEAPARSIVGFWLFPALAMMAVLIAVAVFRGPGGRETAVPIPTLPAWSALPPADQDEGLEVLQALAAQGDPLDAALPPETVAGDLSVLSDEESEVLVDALRHEMGGAGTL
ncbi:MAG TPA: hypothetical protein VFQ51_15000 [Vicinamibacteria bacterium]|nr:hypothetical protein [Vicinamibacteria bacterium]